jgi:sensor histidine kinase YesM
LNLRQIFITILFLTGGLFRLDAQWVPSYHFTEDDGLAGNYVRDIIQDKSGILWIATENGISRYDGERFENMNKMNGLPSNRVWALAQDADQTIYAGCYQGGLAIIKNGLVSKVIQIQGKYPNTFRKLFYSDHYKTIFAGTDDGIYILKDTTLIPVRYPKDTAYVSLILSISGKDSLIFFTALKGESSGSYKVYVDPQNLERSYARRISPDGRFASAIVGDTLYTGEYHSILKYDVHDPWRKSWQTDIGGAFFIWKMSAYEQGEIWIGGLGDGRFPADIYQYEVDKNHPQLLNIQPNNQTVNAILVDTVSKVTWFGRDNGLTATLQSPFEFIRTSGNDNILDIGWHGDSLLVLTGNGVYGLSDGQLSPVLTTKQLKEKTESGFNSRKRRQGLKFTGTFDAARSLDFPSFTQDGDKLYVNSAKGALSVPDLKTYLPFGYGTFTVVSDTCAYSNTKYFSLIRYSAFRDSVGYVVPRDGRGTIMEIFEMIESKGIYYFVSTNMGIFTLAQGKIIRLNETNSPIDNYITDADLDLNGNVWCCSGNGRLYQVGFEDSLVVQKQIDLLTCGLIGNNCKWLKFNRTHLFIGTSKGLNVISIEKLYSDHPAIEYFYNSYNGYDFVSAVSPVIDQMGNIYVHTLHEIVRIRENFPDSTPGVLNVNNLRINNREFDLNGLNGQVLAFSTKQISFHFRQIKFPFSKNVRYRYQVNQSEWTPGNQVNLQSLRSGSYVIAMEAFDTGVMQTTSGTVSFTIRDPFWQTLWFQVLVLISLVLLVYLAMRIRIRNLRRIHEDKTKLLIRNSELQLRSLQLQMNPHFIFNALSSVQGFILSRAVDQGLQYIAVLSKVIRSNLENSSEEYIPLDKEIDFLRKYVEIEEIRFGERIKVEFSNRVSDSSLMIPPMLIQPVVENAIKHGLANRDDSGSVTVTFMQNDGSLEIVIEDNGVGMEFSKSRRNHSNISKGASIIRQRLALLNEKYSCNAHHISFIDLFDDGRPAGTRVVIGLPLKYAQE